MKEIKIVAVSYDEKLARKLAELERRERKADVRETDTGNEEEKHESENPWLTVP